MAWCPGAYLEKKTAPTPFFPLLTSILRSLELFVLREAVTLVHLAH